jgi:hypothetical protein
MLTYALQNGEGVYVKSSLTELIESEHKPGSIATGKGIGNSERSRYHLIGFILPLKKDRRNQWSIEVPIHYTRGKPIKYGMRLDNYFLMI